MANMAIRQVVNIVHPSNAKISPSAFIKPKPPTIIINNNNNNNNNNNIVQFINPAKLWGKHSPIASSKASSADSISPTDSDEDGISLGTMKLPSNTDVARFETLLFQWGNSLCQGANLPLPMPLKVDKIPNGARLGFITADDGDTQVLVYIDCLVFPGSESSAPIFRAVRNGLKKDQPPPGEPRIMRSLLDALKKCVEIARL